MSEQGKYAPNCLVGDRQKSLSSWKLSDWERARTVQALLQRAEAAWHKASRGFPSPRQDMQRHCRVPRQRRRNIIRIDLENLRQESDVLGNLGGPAQQVEKQLNQLSTRLAGFGVTMSPDQLRASESFDKIANQIALNQAKSLGGTDSTRSMSVGATPSTSMSRYGRETITAQNSVLDHHAAGNAGSLDWNIEKQHPEYDRDNHADIMNGLAGHYRPAQ